MKGEDVFDAKVILFRHRSFVNQSWSNVMMSAHNKVAWTWNYDKSLAWNDELEIYDDYFL